ncbi:hypothetical protein D5086_022091 [Populus alba]|uniref:Uncharacterized protein n=1 Tax=Populus alba TaxID=43335 RepID=A0ACC4BE09_POPAL
MTRAAPNAPFRRLPWEEMQKRRAQGLCFNCNERFTAGHKCQGMQLLLLESPTDFNEITYEEVTEEADAEEVTKENDEPEITLHALTGWSALRTMRVDAKVGFVNAVVLIDSGFTHNFISTRMADRLRLPVVPTETFTVRVANGARLQCQGKFEKVQVLLQEIHFSLTLYSLPLADLDIVLVHHAGHIRDPVTEYVSGIEPVNVRPYRYAYFQKAEMEKQVQEMLNFGLIRPSTSPFSSPVLLVKKKDGSCRFCTDYRSLNAVTIKDRFPIPTVEDMLDELHGAAYFTKLDLRAGYHQVRVQPSDIHKTDFRTHNGHYEYLVMPFCLSNAPSTFQAIMNAIFRPHLRKFILASKCAFGKQELEYLGHIVSHQGVKVDNNKIEAMVAWPRPANISELRGFLGLTGYYRKFVRNYGLIARALTNLLKKGQFGWNTKAEEAFQTLKKAMTTTPILAMPNFNDTFIVETDASGNGIGAVLQQQGKPIAFMSRALGVSKCSWSTYAKEMLSVVEAIRMWRPYLLGQHFII